jgi:hypothetical protein
MKAPSVGKLIGCAAVAAAIAACGSTDDSGALLGRSNYGAGGSGSGMSSGSTATSSSGSASTSSSGSSSGTSASTSSSGTTGSSSGVTTAPPPATGPGSTSSQAHQFFDATVYPELTSTCATCHASGANGAPAMMVAPADNTYSSLDALGLIQTNSLLLTKGSHDNGSAPTLTTQETTDITTWLGMEATERSGTAAPTNILAEVAACASATEWNAIGWGNLKTQPRTDENASKCSGCNKALCASCHDGGEQGFFMAEGSDIEPPGTTFQQTFQGPDLATYVIQYFGLNGTTPVASDAIMLKMNAVATGPAYSHPMFVMSSQMQTNLSTFVTDTITNYTNKTCPAADAGTSEDAGQ